MRIAVLFFLTISWHQNGILTQHCGKPEVTRTPVYIYRRIEEIRVKVNRCLFNDTKHAYSDITENCMNAFKTGNFKDKWRHDNQLRDRGSPIVLEEYITTADMIENKIKLRSGVVCRYDRGFCYDPSETVNYAVVWDVANKSLQECPTRLELVFSGFVDIWDIQQGHSKYLVYHNENTDRAFYLKIVRETNCSNKNVMMTEGYSFIVSQQKFDSYSTPLKMFYFPSDTKRKISEAIMKNCDLRQYPLDFTNRIGEDYLKDTKNIQTILKYYQQLILRVKMDVEKYHSGTSSGGISRVWNSIFQNLTKLESLVNKKVYEINAINGSLKKLQQVVDGMSKMEDLNKTLAIIHELQLEDRRINIKIDDEHDALKNLEQKFSELDIFARKGQSIYLTRTEFNKELSSLQREINSKIEVFMNKLESIMKENFTNFKNYDSKAHRDFADRYDNSLEKLENDFQSLSESLNNVRNQLQSGINVTNKAIINNFTLIKNSLAKIEHDIPEIKSVLKKWHDTNNKFVNLEKDLQNHKENVSNINKLRETDIRNIQTYISNIHLLTLNNKYNISEMKNRFENLLKKLGDVDWNIVKALEPDSESAEECRKEIMKFQRQYDKKLDTLSNNLTLVSKQYNTGWSLDFSNFKREIRENTDSLLAEMTRNNSENTKELIEGLNKYIDSELSDIRQSAFINFSNLEIDLKGLKFNMSNFANLIWERLNGSRNDILNMKTELSKCKIASIGTAKFGEDELRDIQNNITNINSIIYGRGISKIERQLTGKGKGIINGAFELNGNSNEYFGSSKQQFEDIVNGTSIKTTTINQWTFRNGSSIENEMNSIQDSSINHEPILGRIDAIDIAVKQLQHESEQCEDSIKILGVSKNELKSIRDIVIETKKRSINNDGEISELKFDLDTITKKLNGIEEINLGFTTSMKKLNESIKSQEKDISNILPQLYHFRGAIDGITSKRMDMEDKIHNCEQSLEHINKKLLKYVEVPGKIDKYTTEIHNLKNQIKTLGTNMMNEAAENKDSLGFIEKNISNILTTLNNKETETSELKKRMKGFVAKFEENKKLIEESKGECMNYVNLRMMSVTEEITQIHNLLLKRGEEIRNVEAQISGKTTTCCEETRKNSNDKDALIKQLQVNLDKVMKQVRNNDESLAKINKLIEDNLNEVPDKAKK